MQSLTRSATLALALALIATGGCAQSNRSSAASAEGGAPTARLAERTWTPQDSPDSIAAWADAGCQGAERQSCLEGALVSVIRPAGVDRAMAALKAIMEKDATMRTHSHAFAHGIGIAAYESPETVSRTFALCTEDFQSGCYHGVIQAYFADDAAAEGGVSAEKLNALCTDYRGPDKRWLLFQCGHGMGHGLMAVNSHHLLKALDGCDLLELRYEREACYGGAFMENIINVTNPHHTNTTRTASADEHAGHGAGGGDAHAGHAAPPAPPAADPHAGHGAQAAQAAHADHGGAHEHAGADAQPFKPLDPAQPLYPCSIVKEQHLVACYQMQTSAILFHNKGNFAAAGRTCETAPEAMRRVCFVSLGRDANSYAAGVGARVIELCSEAPAGGQAWCIVGAVKNMMDITANPDDGLAFCRTVPGGSKAACYHAVGQHAWVLHSDAEGREKVCARAEGSFVPECRRGALLPLVPTE